ncbi:1,4-dihydroxy-2-naphthoate polyprenyltransferase [Rhodohalobacter sp. 8-1]|uniref:1,4-dihydroxy-2-naphthoate polyprenyltransferase n=1 Tax=Rhodohalobacter sp. 8-1 TaxID=3131972 RepID=UPI0030ECD56F
MNTLKLKLWLSAARPKTLAAAVVPVLVGSSIAWYHQLFRLDTTAVALFCAFAIQIGTNFANDYFDFIKGADTDERLGFERATAAGLIKPETMKLATILTMLIAFIAGLYLVWIGGWIVLAIGLSSLLFGVLYTGGPYPLGYNGLGDIFVFIFFGFVAVMGTYYVNTLGWSTLSVWASIPVGALCVNILVVNNLRDIDQDRIANKRTLGVLFGEEALRIEYISMLIISYLSLVIIYFFYPVSYWIFLPLLSLPEAVRLNSLIRNNKDKRTLNKTLGHTARYMFIFGILFSAGFIISAYA